MDGHCCGLSVLFWVGSMCKLLETAYTLLHQVPFRMTYSVCLLWHSMRRCPSPSRIFLLRLPDSSLDGGGEVDPATNRRKFPSSLQSGRRLVLRNLPNSLLNLVQHLLRSHPESLSIDGPLIDDPELRENLIAHGRTICQGVNS